MQLSFIFYSYLTQENSNLKDQCSKLLGDRPPPTGAAGDGNTIEEDTQTPLEKGMK